MVHGAKDATHIWQPVDAGIAREYKRRLRIKYQIWLADTDEGLVALEDEKITVSLRRTLLTKWLGEVSQELE